MNEEKEDFAAEILFYDRGVEESLLKMTNQQRREFFAFCRKLFCLDCGQGYYNNHYECTKQMKNSSHSYAECAENQWKYVRHVNKDPNDTREFYTKVRG